MAVTYGSTWKSIITNPPPKNETVWAYDLFYGHVHLAVWHGGKNDDGNPCLSSLEDHGDDYYLALWHYCDIPFPSKEDIAAARELEGD